MSTSSPVACETQLDDADATALEQAAQAIIGRARSDAALIRSDAISAAQRIVGEAHDRAARIHREAQFKAPVAAEDDRKRAEEVLDGFSPVGGRPEESPASPPAPTIRPVVAVAEAADGVTAVAPPVASAPPVTTAPMTPPSPITSAPSSKSFANLWHADADDVNIEAFLAVELDRKETRKFLRR